jgi:histidinol dehydrogenase
VQFVRASREGLEAVRETIETLAGLEGLPLHARAVEVRT